MSATGNRFVKERISSIPILCMDVRTLLKAKDCLWHKSSMIKGVVPRPGIDIYARWSQSVIPSSGTIGYKLHTAASNGFQADI